MRTGRVVATAAAALTVGGCALLVAGMARADDRTPNRHPAPAAALAADDRPAFLAPDVATKRPAHSPAVVPRSAAPAVRVPAPEPSPSTRPATTTAPSRPVSSAPTTTAAPNPAPSTAVSTTAPTTVPTTAAPSPHPVTHAAAPRTTAPKPAVHAVVPKPAPRTTHKPAPRPAPKPRATSKPRPAPKPTPRPAPRPAGHRLPLPFDTGNATRVVTVTATSHHTTVARLQAWQKVAGGWVRHGRAVTAHIGSDGMSRHASESRSATPIGSFTMTRAFGHDSNPGTPLPYVHTSPADWWISQPGRLYNTLQHCSSGCGFSHGSPNEHLYYETPYYDYAVVIDYNTRNAPGGVRQGAGSAFFLHVTDGRPTAGCVAIPRSSLVPLMRWLSPSTHPRIVIGST